MIVLRHSSLLLVAGILSWWIFLHDSGRLSVPEAHERPTLPVQVMPIVDSELAVAPEVPPAPEEQGVPESVATDPDSLAEAVPEPLEPEPKTEAEPEQEPDEDLVEAFADLMEEAMEEGPPPPEAGTPDGDPESESGAEEISELEPQDEDPLEDPSSAQSFMRSERLVEAAQREFRGETRQGFRTVLLASPEDQIDIARAFGEEVVLVPRRVLDENIENPGYYRLRLQSAPAVEKVDGRPPLESFRQYRDLFDYEYARLPEAVRGLRRSVLSRGEIFLFAALIPVREWAVVIGRREEALARSGRELADVELFTLRYIRVASGFDLHVAEIRFADNSRFRPDATD